MSIEALKDNRMNNPGEPWGLGSFIGSSFKASIDIDQWAMVIILNSSGV
jgi:hypothetical protein